MQYLEYLDALFLPFLKPICILSQNRELKSVEIYVTIMLSNYVDRISKYYSPPQQENVKGPD